MSESRLRNRYRPSEKRQQASRIPSPTADVQLCENIPAECSRATNSPPFANNCSAGSANFGVICLGDAQLIPIASGFLRSCSSKRVWLPRFLTTSGSHSDSQMFTRSQLRRKKKCCACGPASGITAARATCKKPRNKSSRNTVDNSRNALEEALALPGIGNYTAAAILSIAFKQKYAVLDGNVARVLARLGALRGDVRESKHWQELQETADGLLEPKSPGDWNQSMMELGATLCTPKSPQCLLCPVMQFCEGRKLGIAESLPEKRKKRGTVEVTLAAAVFSDKKGQTLLLPPPKNSTEKASADHVPTLVSRMWHFPTVSVHEDPAGSLLAFLRKLFSNTANQQNADRSSRQGPSRRNLPRHHCLALSDRCKKSPAHRRRQAGFRSMTFPACLFPTSPGK